MKNWKKDTSLLLAMVLCLSLTACGKSKETDRKSEVTGDDWRTTGICQGEGTITRDGEDTDVLVCVHKENAVFYYDTEKQTEFDSVDYPAALEGDAGEMFQSIDFADLNDDGNSDVTMKFDDDGNELQMVWYWDTESKQFVNQPEESQPGENDEGRGDLILDEGNEVPVMMGGAKPFTNMEQLESANHKDGTYYYSDITEDGMTTVVNTVMQRNFADDGQTLEEYLTDCALTLGETDNYDLQSIKLNDAYTKNMTYPVYIVKYTTGGNEDTRQWTVFVMDTDNYTYLYGFGTMIDAVDDEMKSVYKDVFAGLYLSDGNN